MPELPEVETTCLGILPHLKGRTITQTLIRHPTLRWPIPKDLPKKLLSQVINNITRRAKYILVETTNGTLLIHLGMSGSIKITDPITPPGKHDHFELCVDSGKALRLTDPRRFGAVLWTLKPETHFLLKGLGPEPLTTEFNAEYLFAKSRTHRVNVKSFIMNAKIVVGVGNIYAAESLFLAGIHPLTPANKIELKEYQILVSAIQKILKAAIKKGGTTLKDFSQSNGKPGYFVQELQVYGREGLPCFKCKSMLQQIKINQRSSAFCPQCQV